MSYSIPRPSHRTLNPPTGGSIITQTAKLAIHGALTLAALTLLLLATARPAHAQYETELYSFPESTDCCGGPAAPVITDGNGNFYSTTRALGQYGNGSVFEVSPNGSEYEYTLYSFCADSPACPDGSYPGYAGVIRDKEGNFYGTTAFGGANGCGVVYELSPSGVNYIQRVLFSFPPAPTNTSINDYNCAPLYGVIMDKAGNLYGTTSYGIISNNGPTGHGGGVFELTQSNGVWKEKLIYKYDYYSLSGVTLDAAGNLYGIGANSGDVPYLFQLSPNGSGGWTPTAIHYFGFKDYKLGSNPTATPTLDAAGNLYGTTGSGGAYNSGAVYKASKTQSGWTYELLYSLDGKDGGENPFGGVSLAANGDIFGTTQYGGTGSDGVVFGLTPNGEGGYTEKVLANFDGSDGNDPLAGVLLSGGNLYGTTSQGGAYSAGLVYEVTP
jgi:uncharacterized repeat protein (TIGR03803 family)